MANDANLLLRDGSVALESTEASPTAKDFGGEDLTPVTYQVDVTETVDGTNPTLDVVIEGSNTSASAGFVTIATFPQITAMGQYHLEAISKYRWRRAKCTVGGTDTPSFHGTIISCHRAGRHNLK